MLNWPRSNVAPSKIISGVDDSLVATGKSLRQTRRLRGLTQTDLADMLGVTQSRIAAWENSYDEIPFRHRMALIDLLTNRTGKFDPFVRNLIKRDPGLIIKSGCGTKYRYLAPRLAQTFFVPTEDNLHRTIPRDPDWGMRDFEFVILAKRSGKKLSPTSIGLETERNIQTIAGKSLRMRSDEFSLQFEDQPRLILSTYTCLGPGNGKKGIVHNHLKLEELDYI